MINPILVVLVVGFAPLNAAQTHEPAELKTRQEMVQRRPSFRFVGSGAQIARGLKLNCEFLERDLPEYTKQLTEELAKKQPEFYIYRKAVFKQFTAGRNKVLIEDAARFSEEFEKKLSSILEEVDLKNSAPVVDLLTYIDREIANSDKRIRYDESVLAAVDEGKLTGTYQTPHTVEKGGQVQRKALLEALSLSLRLQACQGGKLEESSKKNIKEMLADIRKSTDAAMAQCKVLEPMSDKLAPIVKQYETEFAEQIKQDSSTQRERAEHARFEAIK